MLVSHIFQVMTQAKLHLLQQSDEVSVDNLR